MLMVSTLLRRNDAYPHQLITGGDFVTLLQFAAYKGNKKLVEYLLKADADPNIRGVCRCASEALMRLTQGQEGRTKRRFRAAAIGASKLSLSLSVDYANTREQFKQLSPTSAL